MVKKCSPGLISDMFNRVIGMHRFTSHILELTRPLSYSSASGKSGVTLNLIDGDTIPQCHFGTM